MWTGQRYDWREQCPLFLETNSSNNCTSYSRVGMIYDLQMGREPSWITKHLYHKVERWKTVKLVLGLQPLLWQWLMIVVTVWGSRQDENYFNVVSEVNSNSSIVPEKHNVYRYWWGSCGQDSTRNWTWIHQDSLRERICPYFALVLRFSRERWWVTFLAWGNITQAAFRIFTVYFSHIYTMKWSKEHNGKIQKIYTLTTKVHKQISG
jgi:hypothetical protein